MIAQIASGSQVSTIPMKAAPAGLPGVFAELVHNLVLQQSGTPPPHVQHASQPAPQTISDTPVAVASQAIPVPVAAVNTPVVPETEVVAPVAVPSQKTPVADLAVATLAIQMPMPKAAETPVPLISSGTVRQRKPEIATQGRTVPSPVPVVVPVVIPVPPPKPPTDTAERQAHTMTAPAEAPAESRDAAPVVVGPAAVELKIRSQEQPQAPAAESVAIRTVPAPVTVPVLAPAPEPPISHAIVAPATLPQTAPAAAVPVPHVQLQSLAPKVTTQSNPLSPADETVAEEPKTQPVKSMSIEFTPDGAQDVRLRLSERGGDVHISLHSTDPSLSDRLNDGVKDLVHSLTTAGYDAQTWTPGQGRQNQRQADTPRRTRRNGSDDPGAETFGGILQQPVSTD